MRSGDLVEGLRQGVEKKSKMEATGWMRVADGGEGRPRRIRATTPSKNGEKAA